MADQKYQELMHNGWSYIRRGDGGGASLNEAVKAILPLSEIANYGAEYTYEDDKVLGKCERVKITSEVNANDFIFITKDDAITTFQFWDKNGLQSVYGGGNEGRQFIVVKNIGTSVIVNFVTNGSKVFDYNSDGTFRRIRDLNYAYKVDVLDIRNRTEYTPTEDYHPATKKYVDDNSNASLVEQLGADVYTLQSDVSSLQSIMENVSTMSPDTGMLGVSMDGVTPSSMPIWFRNNSYFPRSGVWRISGTDKTITTDVEFDVGGGMSGSYEVVVESMDTSSKAINTMICTDGKFKFANNIELGTSGVLIYIIE